ncbi:MAG: TolC family protein [Thermodesulfobacteriota bacterium]|nr:TolC family protein [Thermodesulfobacteriota bacterium]
MDRIKQIIFTLHFLLILLMGGGINHGSAQEIGRLSLKSLIDKALKENPILLAKANQISSLKERIPQASTLPDPKLKLGLVNLPESFDFNDEGMTQKQISLSQKFPFPGKLSLNKEMALKDLKGLEAEFAYQQLETISGVKNIFYSLFFIERAIEITGKNKSTLINFLEITRARYSVGKGIQQDVLKAEVELSRMLEKLVILKQQRITITAKMNTLLNRPPSTPLEGKTEIFRTPFNLNPEEIKNSSLEDHPLLRSIEFIREKAEIAYNLALKDYYPNFEVNFSYGQREDSLNNSRPDFYSGFVGINIPIWYKTKQNRKVKETEYNISSVISRYKATQNDLQFEISKLLAEIDQNSHLLDLYQGGIIPQANHTLDSSIAGYQVGTIDFLTLLTNLLTLYKYELEYYKVLTDREKNLADLELAAGKCMF